ADGEQRRVADDAKQRRVACGGDAGPPGDELPEGRERSRRESLGALDALESLTVVRWPRPAQVLEMMKLLLGPGEATQGREPLGDGVPEARQVPRVVGGIGEHGGCEGALRPVGALMRFGEPDADVLLAQRGQTDRR